jgi:hypothetical protein
VFFEYEYGVQRIETTLRYRNYQKSEFRKITFQTCGINVNVAFTVAYTYAYKRVQLYIHKNKIICIPFNFVHNGFYVKIYLGTLFNWSRSGTRLNYIFEKRYIIIF